jgi:tripartite-type tricarboxylate transporter receptor subunit TctC
MIVGYAAGGGADTTARVLSQKMSEDLGQPIVVENRPGASGVIAVAGVAKSPPDGYTLLMMTAGEVVQPALRTNLPYDLLADLAPVSLVGVSPFVLVVHPSVPARTIDELIALAKSKPGELNFGSSGIGTSPHLAGELFALMSKTQLAHIPYKGGAQAAAATVSGEIQISFPATTSAIPLVQAGRIRALAVTTSRRTPFMPSVPTLDESGLRGFERSSWYGLLVPAGTPKDIVTRLHDAILKALNEPEVRRVLEAQGIEPVGNTPEQLSAFMRAELKQNATLVQAAGIKTK